MLKVFQNTTTAGDSAEFWDHSWDSHSVDDATAACERDPVWPLVMRSLVPGGTFLEGGCGQGQWVRYLAELGHRAVGVDFAPRTIQRLRERHPALEFRQGDIASFDLPDASVDTYYSAGVVEHFEDGPRSALTEAFRVLRPSGTFLCSVPDASPLRRALYRTASPTAGATGWTVVRTDKTRSEPAPPGTNFFQYMFTEAEFRAHLEAAGFQVQESVGLYVTWGLMEVPGFERVWRVACSLARLAKRAAAPGVTFSALPATVASSAAASPTIYLPGLVERAVIREDHTTPLLGPLVQVAAKLFPNMRMFVATRS